ncbi:MAG: hypothetical protein D6746_13835 [Bacteroidetes bacterium]|nr:MAG: hypothetical protein D6746_13835 [Bacteroidota bacterium]
MPSRSLDAPSPDDVAPSSFRRLPRRLRYALFWGLTAVGACSTALTVLLGPNGFFLGAAVSLLMIVALWLHERNNVWSIIPRSLGWIPHVLFYALILLNIAAACYALLRFKFP